MKKNLTLILSIGFMLILTGCGANEQKTMKQELDTSKAKVSELTTQIEALSTQVKNLEVSNRQLVDSRNAINIIPSLNDIPSMLLWALIISNVFWILVIFATRRKKKSDVKNAGEKIVKKATTTQEFVKKPARRTSRAKKENTEATKTANVEENNDNKAE